MSQQHRQWEWSAVSNANEDHVPKPCRGGTDRNFGRTHVPDCISLPAACLSVCPSAGTVYDTVQFSILVCSFLFNFLLLFAVFFLV